MLKLRIPAPSSLDGARRRSVSASVGPVVGAGVGVGGAGAAKGGTLAVKRPPTSRSGSRSRLGVAGPLPALTFTGVSYEIDGPRQGAARRRLLAGVTGFVRGGSLTALMGSSGAGKTCASPYPRPPPPPPF
eukprot:tig00000227_g19799.t1